MDIGEVVRLYSIQDWFGRIRHRPRSMIRQRLRRRPLVSTVFSRLRNFNPLEMICTSASPFRTGCGHRNSRKR
jgi:hypothetical protein